MSGESIFNDSIHQELRWWCKVCLHRLGLVFSYVLISSAHQGWIYLIKNTVKLWNIIRIELNFSMWIFISVMRSCIFSIITAVFSVTWSSEIIIIYWFTAQEHFWLLSMLKTVVLHNIFVEIVMHCIFQDSQMNRKIKRTAFIWNINILHYKCNISIIQNRGCFIQCNTWMASSFSNLEVVRM